MKKLLFFALATGLASIAASGQAAEKAMPVHVTPPASPASAASVPKPKPLPFPREKFDPARDPKLDLERAVAAAGKSGKRIIMDIGGEWCGWCIYMDRFFYQNPELDKLRDDNYIWLKVNFSEENENPVFLAPYPARDGYPHLYVLDSAGKLLHSQETSVLEEGKGYNLARFTEFLNTWSPPKQKSL